MKQLWFTFSEFGLLPGEEEKVNPDRFGEVLAKWVQSKLAAEGYIVEETLIPEDWGWIVMLQRKPFALWLGCGNADESLTRWSLFVEAELGLFQKIFKRIAPNASVCAVEKALERFVKEAGFDHVQWE